MEAYPLVRYGKTKTLLGIVKVAQGLTESKIMWRLLGFYLVLLFSRVDSSWLVRTEVLG